MKNSQNAKDVMKEVEATLAKIIPNQVHPFTEKDLVGALVDFRYPGSDPEVYRLAVDIDPDCDLVRVIVTPNQPIPAVKEDLVLEFLNSVNRRTGTGHFFIYPETKRVQQVGGILVKKKFFRPEELERLIRVLLGNGQLCFKGLNEVLQGKGNPLEISQKLFGEVDSHMTQ